MFCNEAKTTLCTNSTYINISGDEELALLRTVLKAISESFLAEVVRESL